MKRPILITGGAGFIGSALIRHLIESTERSVVNVDCLTYAASVEAVAAVSDSPRYAFEQVDVRDGASLKRVFDTHSPAAVIHLAAESHVDRSIDGPLAFVQANVLGTCTLLSEAQRYHVGLGKAERDAFRFINVSTDEVFGSLGEEGRFSEETPYDPRSPYSASKAAADHFARVWHGVYGLPVMVTNCSNNYGPFQFPEKLIPNMILRALEGRSLPIYGDGRQVRDWLFVDDHVAALLAVLENGTPGETYCIGGNAEHSNIDIVHHVCELLDELRPTASGVGYAEQIEFVADRRAHDRRYAIDARKIERELGWTPAQTFDSGLRHTVEWYLTNQRWWQMIREHGYGGERLGLKVSA